LWTFNLQVSWQGGSLPGLLPGGCRQDGLAFVCRSESMKQDPEKQTPFGCLSCTRWEHKHQSLLLQAAHWSKGHMAYLGG
jgi:hypothetical protein